MILKFHWVIVPRQQLPAILQRRQVLKMSDAEDNTKTVDRESKESKDKIKEDGDHLDNQVGTKTDEGKDDGGKNKEKVTPNKKNAKTKNQKKEEDNEDEEEDDDEEDSSDEENDKDGKVPLLDQPLQISGTRDRKKVQRFTEEFKVLPRESPKNEIPEGRGTQLGEIPRIEAIIQKSKIEKLKPLYKVLFRGIGKAVTLKKNIRKFNGFDFKEGSDQHTKKRASLLKMDMASLKGISRSLDLTTGGSREEIVNRLLDFLMEPKQSEKPVKEPKTKRASTSSTKKGKGQNTNTSKGKKKKNESDDEISSEAEEETEENDEKESSEEEKESEDESDEDSKKKQPAKKKPTANAKKPTPKKTEQKKETESKKAESKTAEKKKRKEAEMKSDDDESSSEDEPLVKKAKQPPTDDEIKSYVKQILEGANLEEITMKTVCKQVYAAYPEFDLAHKKDFIKTTVKSLIST
ncbi:hypothetical protein J437_LFUL005786 [Ladona fulva]|uniref:Protein DEK n=1 Tax=Ladona fulva TaxID=123851 RepID=A0A8K0JYB3_LADFU|nr:hypothetical protein J437_LFUL005786 [Ladona fulva]